VLDWLLAHYTKVQAENYNPVSEIEKKTLQLNLNVKDRMVEGGAQYEQMLRHPDGQKQYDETEEVYVWRLRF
jgi:hypothetical protein